MSSVQGTGGTVGSTQVNASTAKAPEQNNGGVQTVNQQVDNTMFTQEQVNSIVSGRVGTLNAKIDELTKQLADATKNADTFKAELDQFKQKADLAKAGIPDSVADYAIFEISKLGDNGKTFAENALEYAKANEALIKAIQTNKQSSNDMQNGTQQQGQSGMQSSLLQQLAGKQINTNGAGTQSIQSNNNSIEGLDMDKLLAEHGIKRRK